jgi:hypothetical protein
MADISAAARSLSNQSDFVPLTDKELEEHDLILDDLGILIDEDLHKQNLPAKFEVFDDQQFSKFLTDLFRIRLQILQPVTLQGLQHWRFLVL